MIIFSTTPSGPPTSQLKDFYNQQQADAVFEDLKKQIQQVSGYLTVFKLYA
jgi:hypothetical protein